MKVKDKIRNIEWLRQDIIGRNMLFETPFGKRPLVYADYTASFMQIIQRVQEDYILLKIIL